MSAEKGAQSSCARLKELTVVVEVDVLKITISQQFPNAARQFRSGKGDHAGEYRADEAPIIFTPTSRSCSAVER